MADWAELGAKMHANLFQTSYKNKIQLLSDINDYLSDSKDESAINDILTTLLSHYGSFTDNKLIALTTNLLDNSFNLKPTTIKIFISQLEKTLLKYKSLAYSDLNVLSKWVDLIITKHFEQDLLIPLANVEILIIDNLLYQSDELNDNEHRLRLRLSILDNIKSSLSHLSADQLSQCLKLVNDVNFKSIDASVTLTGIISQLLHELPEADKSLVLNYYTKVVLMHKFPLLNKSALSPFFKKFINEKDLTESIIPSLEKAILRSPELAFSITNEIFMSINPKIIDPVKILVNSKLLSQLISNYKSSKEINRDLAFKVFSSIFLSSENDDDIDAILKVAEELLKSIKSVTVAEQKATLAKSLFLLPLSEQVSSKIINALSPLVLKDQNEISLSESLNAFFKHFISCDYSNSDAKTTIIKGLKDPKLHLRKIWFTALGDNLPTELNNDLENILLELFPTFITSFDEVLKNPTNNIKGISIPYVVLTIANKLKKNVNFNDLFEKSISNNEKPSILINSRIYSKLSTNSEKTWFLNGLLSICSEIKEVNSEFGKAISFLILNKESNYKVVCLAVKILTSMIKINPQVIGKSVIGGLYDLLLNSKDLAEMSLNFSLTSRILFATINKSTEEEINIELLSKALVISHHSAVILKNFSWVSLALHSNIDPALVVEKFIPEILEEISNILITATTKTFESGIFDAATSSLATLSFIHPDIVGPLLKDLIVKFINVEQISHISEQDITIWKTKEGELVVNVLEQGKKVVEDKNSKDYETRKWEESLRKEVAKKNTGTTKKLTKEQQTLVNEQLAKESTKRAEIQKVYSSLRSGLGIINALSKNAELINNGQTFWFSIAVNKTLELLSIPISNQLVGILSTNVFLGLSNVVSSKLGPLKYLLGIATLRSYDIGLVSDDFKLEDLLDLISRLLFRMKFLSGQQPFDFFTLIYSLPLLTKVLELGKVFAIQNSNKPTTRSEFVEESKEEEQLLLAIEIIENHAEEFKNTVIPRDKIIGVLLSLLSLPSRAKLAKDSLSTLCQYISMDYTENDLQLLFGGVISRDAFVRNAILEILDQEFDLSGISKYTEIWIACHDNDESNAEIALTIWQESKFVINDSLIKSLYTDYLSVEDGGIRLSASKALASAIHTLESIDEVLDTLLGLYVELTKPPAPILDEFGLVIKSSKDQKDKWEARSGIALTFKYIADVFKDEHVVKVIKFFIDEKALGDKEFVVAEEFKDAAISIMDTHGKSNVEQLIPVFELALSGTGKGDELLRENVVVLYGALAKHLSSDDSRLTTIVDRLLKTLSTPSERVQKAICNVIAPLVPLFQNKVGSYIDQQFKLLFQAPLVSTRRGAAYGIAGLVKGYGISAFSDFDVIRNLSDAADDKKDPKRRQSVAIAFECLSESLGKFFEPYAIEILPIILKSFGDTVPEVRDETSTATKVIMKNTTSYGVKKLIPLAIENLDDISWRSKKGSVELLGSMAYLDPTQLSNSLSTIIPEIVGVLNDSHKEVRKAGDQALNKFGEVIRNPEIKTLVPILIKAIGDPTKYTDEALDSLIKTQFVHYIDGPSLAIIIHVIDRGMRDRSANTKRKACQIVGNMAILVNSKDLLPYLHQLISQLQTAMVDPVPNTRSTAARALGSLVEKLGEDHFPGLISRLLDTLSDETKAGDRLGSAQALAEVISGIGLRKLDELLPIILKGAMNSKAYIREGYLPLLLFLPVCFGSQFAPYISQVIPAILNGLADTDESIRSTAVKAGRLLVKNYANKAIDLLLPELESGLLDNNYRIRLSSIELTGDLLFQVTGISGKNELVEDDTEFSGVISKQLIEVLGLDRRDRVLSLLFICRSDTSGVVRNAAIDIWKSLVANTPRTIKEILPTLTNIIIRRLANSDESQRNIAAATLGELVRRVGANALSQLLPTLQDSLDTSDADAKQGICIAIHELIESSSKETVEEYRDIFVDIIRSTLVDSSSKVRSSAAQVFDVYQNVAGKLAVDEIIPYLLNLLQDSENSDNALSALEEIMTTKSEVIFPILIPTLLSSPIDAFRAQALGSLAQVAGSALYKRLTFVINTLVNELISSDLDAKTRESLSLAFDQILLSVEDEEGLHPLLQQLLSLIKGEDSKKRAVVYEHLPVFFNETLLDYSIYTSDLVGQCILSLDDQDREVVKYDVLALTALTKKQSKDSLERLIRPAKQALDITGVSGEDLYGFTLPKGAQSILPIFLHGLMYGTSEQREISAMGIADVVSKTPSANLKPLVTVITGPLIRVIGERFSSDVKSAILYALNILFDKIATFLRPFIPQLQRTFVKSLSDPSNETLRLRAAKALGSLIEYQPRVDPLVIELVNGCKSAENFGVKTAMLRALLEVISKAGDKMSENSKNLILELIEEEILIADEKLNIAYARLIGSLSKILTVDEASKILKSKVLNDSVINYNEDNDKSKFGILTLNAFLKDAPTHIFNDGLLGSVISTLSKGCNSSSAFISDNSIIAVGKLLLIIADKGDDSAEINPALLKELVEALSTDIIKPTSNSLETRRLALVVARTVSRKSPGLFKPYFNILIPSIFTSVRDVIIPIKLAAEKAYLSVLGLVDDVEMKAFNEWFSNAGDGPAIESIIGTKVQLRSIGDYTKRVGHRLASVERERIEAGGDEETLFSDRIEDEKEIWAVGGVDLKTV